MTKIIDSNFRIYSKPIGIYIAVFMVPKVYGYLHCYKLFMSFQRQKVIGNSVNSSVRPVFILSLETILCQSALHLLHEHINRHTLSVGQKYISCLLYTSDAADECPAV